MYIGVVLFGGAILLLIVLLLIQVLILPLPKPILRSLVLRSYDWILTDDLQLEPGAVGAVRRVGRRFAALLVEYSLIRQYQARGAEHRRVEMGGHLNYVVDEITRLNYLMVSQNSVKHPAASWRVFLSGIGYCDQLNGVAAILLAKKFSSSQTVDIIDPSTAESHTVGRVWSSDYNDWLYFDVFLDEEVIVFRKAQSEPPQILARRKTPWTTPLPTVSPDCRAMLGRFYNLAERGVILNEYPASFGRYLGRRIWIGIWNRTLIPTVSNRVSMPGSIRREQAMHGQGSSDVSLRDYLEARLEHILGSPSRAALLYAKVGRIDVPGSVFPLAQLVKASNLFSQELISVAEDHQSQRSVLK